MSSCYKCAERYSFFKKEVGCGNCGFSFCSKCCSEKIKVPKKNNKVLNVCNECLKKLKNESNSKSESVKDPSPPANFLKLMEENNAKKNFIRKTEGSNKVPNKNDPDKELSDRLAKLYDSNKANKPQITDEEIEKRLNKLKGLSEEGIKNTLPSEDIIKTPNDLINKINDEIQIEKKFSNESNNDDNIIDKMLKEAEDQIKKSKTGNEYNEDENWCYFCNKDATLQCLDCDDFYCKECFRKSHSNREYKNHNFEEF